HADAAREPIGERRVEPPLNVGDDVQHRLRRMPRHVVGDDAATARCAATAPDANGKHAHGRTDLPRVIVVAPDRVLDLLQLTMILPRARQARSGCVFPALTGKVEQLQALYLARWSLRQLRDETEALRRLVAPKLREAMGAQIV